MTRARLVGASVAVVAALTALAVLVSAGVMVGMSGLLRLRDSQDGLPAEPDGGCAGAEGARLDVEACRDQHWLADAWLPLASAAGVVAVAAVVVLVATARRPTAAAQ